MLHCRSCPDRPTRVAEDYPWDRQVGKARVSTTIKAWRCPTCRSVAFHGPDMCKVEFILGMVLGAGDGVGEELRFVRHTLMMTKEELAHAIDANPTMIEAWESTEHASIPIEQWKKIIRIQIDRLYKYNEER